jgi:hypothetical protein
METQWIRTGQVIHNSSPLHGTQTEIHKSSPLHGTQTVIHKSSLLFRTQRVVHKSSPLHGTQSDPQIQSVIWNTSAPITSLDSDSDVQTHFSSLMGLYTDTRASQLPSLPFVSRVPCPGQAHPYTIFFSCGLHMHPVAGSMLLMTHALIFTIPQK